MLVAYLVLAYLAFTAARAKFFYDSLSRQETGDNVKPENSKNRSVGCATDFFLYMLLFPTSRSQFFWNCVFAPIWEQPVMIMTTPKGFAEMHGYRFIAAKGLMRRLNRIQPKLILKRISGERPSDDELRPVCNLLDRLWIVTGDDSFRQAKEDWNAGRAFDRICS